MQDIYILAGPNGAGKTTAAKTVFPETLKIIEFVNADEIAKGLSPFNWEDVAFESGRIMIKRIHQLSHEKKDFGLETTLSSKNYLKFIETVKQNGYNVTLVFLYLNNVDIAQQRVAKRVSEGGHNIPIDVVERRYYRGLKNLKSYFNVVNNWYCYDNSNGQYELIAKKTGDKKTIINFEIWNRIQK
jgi:predicted ABC-type ATPase